MTGTRGTRGTKRTRGAKGEHRTPSPVVDSVAVAAGGALGSVGRWLVTLRLPGAGAGPAWSTLAVNVTGALAMGLLVAWLETRRDAHPLIRPFAAVGVLGGWTTYSALALDLRTMLADGRAGHALLYVVLTTALGVGAAAAGLVVGAQRLGGDKAAGGAMIEEEEL